MDIQVINSPLSLTIYGFAGIAINKNYAATGFKLMDKMWQVIRANKLSSKGKNIWVYEPGEAVFAGVEFDEAPAATVGLQVKTVNLTAYAYYKHTGSYNLLPQAGQNVIKELSSRGIETRLPYVEIYGHWTSDDTKLETELLWQLK